MLDSPLASSLRFAALVVLCIAAMALVGTEQPQHPALLITYLALVGVVVAGVCIVVGALVRNERALTEGPSRRPHLDVSHGPKT